MLRHALTTCRYSDKAVLGHDLHGVRAVGLEDANRPGGADPMAVQEDHDLRYATTGRL